MPNDERPAIAETARELALVFDRFEKRLCVVVETERDPILREILVIVRNLGGQIARFFAAVSEIIREPQTDRELRFLHTYFIRHYSILSENTRASKSIIAYILSNMEWFNQHADRIVEVLKVLYAELLAMQIDCEESFRQIYGSVLKLTIRFPSSPEAGLAGAAAVPMGLDEARRILGVGPKADREQVKSAFRRLAKERHPDLNPGAPVAEFVVVEYAYKRMLSVLKSSENYSDEPLVRFAHTEEFNVTAGLAPDFPDFFGSPTEPEAQVEDTAEDDEWGKELIEDLGDFEDFEDRKDSEESEDVDEF